MQNLSLWARAGNYFKARSVGRDAETDRSRIASVAAAIEHVIHSAEAEHADGFASGDLGRHRALGRRRRLGERGRVAHDLGQE